MKNREQLTPVAAAVTALSTLLCCVPTSFAAAVATTGAGLFVADHQGWFLAASVLLIGIGMLQLRSGRLSCSTARRRVSAILLGVSHDDDANKQEQAPATAFASANVRYRPLPHVTGEPCPKGP